MPVPNRKKVLHVKPIAWKAIENEISIVPLFYRCLNMTSVTRDVLQLNKRGLRWDLILPLNETMVVKKEAERAYS